MNAGLEEPLAEELGELMQDFPRHGARLLEEGAKHAEDRDARVHLLAQTLEMTREPNGSGQTRRLEFYRDQNVGARSNRVDRQHPECRRAVCEDEVIVRSHAGNSLSEPRGRADRVAEQFEFEVGERVVGRHEVETEVARHVAERRERCPAVESEARRGVEVRSVELVVEAEELAGVPLRVVIDQKNALLGAARATARFTAVVVFATPPFWFTIAMPRACTANSSSPAPQPAGPDGPLRW